MFAVVRLRVGLVTLLMLSYQQPTHTLDVHTHILLKTDMVPLLLLYGETLAMTPSCHVAMLGCFSRQVLRDWRLHLVATGFSTLLK
jgi:hypothetical protein